MHPNLTRALRWFGLLETGRRLELQMRLRDARALPDAMIIGAMKCGTSSLHNYLTQHAQVIAPLRKEIHTSAGTFRSAQRATAGADRRARGLAATRAAKNAARGSTLIAVAQKKSDCALFFAGSRGPIVALGFAWAIFGTGPADTAEPGQPTLHVVTSDGDDGPGTLRAAVAAALASPGPDLIRFDATAERFREPRRIALASPLPAIDSTVTIDGYFEDRLWQAAGVTLDGGEKRRIFDVAPGGRLKLRALTLAHGAARDGGAIQNRGTLELDGVTLIENRAERAGGGVLSADGALSIVNSTFAGNAAARGGALAVEAGSARIVNSTFAANEAATGGAIANAGRLHLSNSILAGSLRGEDCTSSVPLNPASAHNLVQTQAGCGTPMLVADPVFGRLGYYNGSTPTLPLEAGSPAINAGINAAAADASGRPLEWDQRGNGDPRFVAGIVDLGAFEVQSVLDLTVDTASDDSSVRGCTGYVPDCSLRAAVELANAIDGPNEIRIGVDVHGTRLALRLTEPLPPIAGTLKLMAPSPGCTIVIPTPPKVVLGGMLELDGVRFTSPDSASR